MSRLIWMLALEVAVGAAIRAQAPLPTTPPAISKNYYIGVFGGQQSWRLYQAPNEAPNNQLVPGLAFGVRAEQNFTRYVGMEESWIVWAENNLKLTPAQPYGQRILGVGSRNGQIFVGPLFYLRPRSANVRPFLTLGPAFEYFNPTRDARRQDQAISAVAAPVLKTSVGPAFGFGGGLLFRVRERWNLRLDVRGTLTGNADYHLSNVPAGPGSLWIASGGSRIGLQTSIGIEWGWGRGPKTRIAVSSVSPDHSGVCPGEVVHVNAISDAPTTATYQWTINGNPVGQGKTLLLETTNLAAGRHAIAVSVSAEGYDNGTGTTDLDVLTYVPPSAVVTATPAEILVGGKSTVAVDQLSGQCGGPVRLVGYAATAGTMSGSTYDSTGVQVDPQDRGEERKSVILTATLRDDRTVVNSSTDVVLKDPPDCLHQNKAIRYADKTSGSPWGRDGLIMHEDGFGDTAQREGWYWLGVWIRQNRLDQPWIDHPSRQLSFDDVLKKLEPNGDGVFVRAPGKDPFGRPTDGYENNGTTRDQLVPLIAAMGVWGKHDELQRLWYALPEDILGKHDFQGHWHDLTNNTDTFSSDPCTEAKNRSCPLKVDIRPCDLQDDKRSCEPTWSCDCALTDFSCSKYACEIGKGTYRTSCETAKAAQNALYAGQKAACETGKATQNGLYAAEQVACNAQKVVDLGFCESKKLSGLLLFTGDPLPPKTYNLFVRAGVIPISPVPATLTAVSPVGFLLGETDLKLAVDTLRNQATGAFPCPHSADMLDCVDQDMNTIVMLWMSQYKLSTHIGDSAIASYKSRAHSYGSYFERYCEVSGPLIVQTQCSPGDTQCCTSKQCLDDRLKRGIQAGIQGASPWLPDNPAYGPYGAIRWYHRWSTGANPGLAILWQPIINDLLK